jgi:hypothetical protein
MPTNEPTNQDDDAHHHHHHHRYLTPPKVVTYAYCNQKMLATTVAAKPRPATVFTALRRARPKISSWQHRCTMVTMVTEKVLKV